MTNLNSEAKRVEAAEAELIAARDAMRAAASRNGISTDGLFGDSLFVWRSTAKSWKKEAYEQGCDKGFRETIQAFEIMRDGGFLEHIGRLDVLDGKSAADQLIAELINAARKKTRGRCPQ